MEGTMKYYEINTCPTADHQLAILNNPPQDTADFSYLMMDGKPAAGRFPADAKCFLTKESPGKRLASLLANTDSFLVVDAKLKDALAEGASAVECLRFALYDEKKKLLSKDYFIVNPIGTLDCLHKEKSEIKYRGDEVVKVRKPVLDTRKLADAPDLFRVKEDPTIYVVSDRLVKKLQALKPTNLFLKDLEQAS
jgi:hypothetical protein